MNELLAATARWLPLTWIPILLLLLAPTASRRGRRAIVLTLTAWAAGAVGYGLLFAPDRSVAEVINPFLDPEVGHPVPFVVDRSDVPGWAWPLAAAILLGLAAAAVAVLRNRPSTPPCPVTFAIALSIWTLAARLALEKTAAPQPLVWSIGISMPMLLLLPFVGWWSGLQRFSFMKLLLVLFLISILQRSLIAGCGLVATMLQLGTHLDVSAIREVTLLVGHREFAADAQWTQWHTLIAVPQFLLWVPATVVLGLVLGGLPYRLARQRAASAPA